MSWKGAARSFVATTRRIERDQQRRGRVAAQQFKQLQKEEAITNATQAVANYNEYLGVIKSVHHDCNDPIDWVTIQREPTPVPPLPSTEHEQKAQLALDTYQPGFFDRLFKRGPGKVKRMTEAVGTARQQDQQLTAERQAEHARQLTAWQDRQDLTRQVLAKDSDVYSQVLEIFTPFEGIRQLGSRLEFTFTADHIEVDVHVGTAEVIPDFVVTQLASGKLSRKTLPISKFNELYQDYVCGCLLRVAREVQAHLPVSQVVVHALTKQLNPATGLIENQVIASAAMPRDTLAQLNFTALDPSDSMRNFNHTMKFTKTGGFQAVDRVGLAAPIQNRKK
ncbi:hypothetical protein H8B13_00895 [Hymenobacter sp. BT188]|uniref:hypothetical protein n=1 Tax=Hymenobacter sp. BT188 TaxID=2763504 RepID=UPI001651A173|nr:hypothetical protein [Hymenobacter sp. BT188]MBC6605365.1 hypothetical protein [Hymenobacter sp. BT188]